MSGGKAKVGEDNSGTVLVAQDILRLQVPVENAIFMAIFDRVDDLEENIGDEGIVVKVPVCFGRNARNCELGCFNGRLDRKECGW